MQSHSLQFVVTALCVIATYANAQHEVRTEPLPENAVDMCIADEGQLLALRFKELRKIGILDLSKARFRKYIRTGDTDCRMAAGGRKLLVYSPTGNILRVFSLEDFRLIKELAVPKLHKVTCMVMGMSNDSIAMVLGIERQTRPPDPRGRPSSPEDMPAILFLDMRTWTFHSLATTPPLNDRGKIPMFMRASQDLGSNFGAHADPQMRSVCFFDTYKLDCVLGTFAGGNRYVLTMTNGVRGPVYFGGGPGGYLLETRGQVMTGAFVSKRNVDRPGSSDAPFLFPVLGSDLCVTYAYATRTVTVADSASGEPVNSFHLDLQFSTDWTGLPCSWAWASAKADKIAFVTRTQTPAVHVVDLGIAQTKIERPTPGRTWRRSLSLPQGTKVMVADGPSGMVLDASGMTLVWAIPKNQSPGRVSVLLSIVEPGKTERWQEVHVDVQ